MLPDLRNSRNFSSTDDSRYTVPYSNIDVIKHLCIYNAKQNSLEAVENGYSQVNWQASYITIYVLAVCSKVGALTTKLKAKLAHTDI